MASPKAASLVGFRVPQASDHEDSDDDQSDLPTSNSDVEMTSNRQFQSEVGHFPKSTVGEVHRETPKNKMLPVQSEAKASDANAKSSGPTRPSNLQYISPASAPEVPQRLPSRNNATAKKRSPRSVSQGQPISSTTKLNQASQTVRAHEESGETRSLVPSTTGKRRRSDQDMTRKNNIKSQTCPRSCSGPTSSRLLGLTPSPSSDSPPRPDKSGGTSHRPALKSDLGSSDNGEPPSTTSSDTAVESPSEPNIRKIRRIFAPSDPVFVRYVEEHMSVLDVTQTVFETMMADLNEKKDSDYGYVYMLRMVDRKGFFKIGRTNRNVRTRIKEIQRCITQEIQEVKVDGFNTKLANHTRIERLIHEELRNSRRQFPCTCLSTQQKYSCDTEDKMTNHDEWFEVEEETAIEVITRWKDWMRTEPYSNSMLERDERLRINMYHRDSVLMKAMTTRSGKGWNWQIFMRNTIWQRTKLRLHDNFFEARHERSTYSAWHSLWKHWKSNVVFGLVFFILSYFLSVLSDVILSSSAFGPLPAVLNTLILGSGAILYAA